MLLYYMYSTLLAEFILKSYFYVQNNSKEAYYAVI